MLDLVSSSAMRWEELVARPTGPPPRALVSSKRKSGGHRSEEVLFWPNGRGAGHSSAAAITNVYFEALDADVYAQLNVERKHYPVLMLKEALQKSNRSLLDGETAAEREPLMLKQQQNPGWYKLRYESFDGPVYSSGSYLAT